MRSLANALAAGAASLLLPVALGLTVFFEGPEVDAAGHPDNDPYRAAAFLLMLTPLFLVFATGYFLTVAWALRRFYRFSRGTLFAFSAGVALAVGLFFAADDLHFGTRNAAISFGLFGGFSFVALALGSLVLWGLRPAA